MKVPPTAGSCPSGESRLYPSRTAGAPELLPSDALAYSCSRDYP